MLGTEFAPLPNMWIRRMHPGNGRRVPTKPWHNSIIWWVCTLGKQVRIIHDSPQNFESSGYLHPSLQTCFSIAKSNFPVNKLGLDYNGNLTDNHRRTQARLFRPDKTAYNKNYVDNGHSNFESIMIAIISLHYVRLQSINKCRCGQQTSNIDAIFRYNVIYIINNF